MSAIGTFLHYLYYLCYPFVLLIKWLVALFVIITAPVLHVGHYIWYACWWPWRFLGRFETLYIFFGVAILVGAFAGTFLHYSSAFFMTTLNLNAAQHERGRTLASYRAQHKEKHAKNARISMPRVDMRPKIGGTLKDDNSEWLKQQDKNQAMKGLLSTTILEEDDSSEAGF